jgi:hypothetical protein
MGSSCWSGKALLSGFWCRQAEETGLFSSTPSSSTHVYSVYVCVIYGVYACYWCMHV